MSPSGITAAIYEGNDVPRDEFLMRVARSYSLAILQREDDPDAPVKRVEADTRYYDEKIAGAEADLRELSEMSVAQAVERSVAEHDKAVEEWNAARVKALALRGRYEAMIAKVEAWEPPALVAYIKDGALKQLRESIDFDCGKPGEEMKYLRYPQHLAGAKWIEAKTAEARREIDYGREQIAKQQKLATERNEHIDAFLGSLGTSLDAAEGEGRR
jgi:hypothetical protein